MSHPQLSDHPLFFTLACINQAAYLQKVCNMASHGFVQHIDQHTLQQHFALTSLQSCHVAKVLCRSIEKYGNGQVSEVRFLTTNETLKMQYDAACIRAAGTQGLLINSWQRAVIVAESNHVDRPLDLTPLLF